MILVFILVSALIGLIVKKVLEEICKFNPQVCWGLGIHSWIFISLVSFLFWYEEYYYAYLVLAISGCIFFPTVCVNILKNKGYSNPKVGILWGLFLGIFGIIICALAYNTHNKETSYSPSNSVDELLKLSQLLEKGLITQEEFDTKKRQLLNINH